MEELESKINEIIDNNKYQTGFGKEIVSLVQAYIGSMCSQCEDRLNERAS